MLHTVFLTILLMLVLTGCDPSSQTAPSSAAENTARTLDWDELMPADFQPGALFEGVDLASLADDDPKARELMTQLREIWDKAPVVETLNGAQIRLPGFAIPLETDGQSTRQFLLVPYYGACIHVPPPPANQTVLVEAPAGVLIHRVFDAVWVTGRLAVEPVNTGLAKAGYTLVAAKVEPYVIDQNTPSP